MIRSEPPFSDYFRHGLVGIECVSHGYEMQGWMAITEGGIARAEIGELPGEWPIEVVGEVDIDGVLGRLRAGWKHEFEGPATRWGRIAAAKGAESHEAPFDRGNIDPEKDEVQRLLSLASAYIPFEIEQPRKG